MMSIQFVFLILFLCIPATASTVQETPPSQNFDERTQLPMKLDIWLVGDSGNIDYMSSELKKSLESMLPFYLPDSTSEIEFNISYNIISKGKKILQAYKSIFQST